MNVVVDEAHFTRTEAELERDRGLVPPHLFDGLRRHILFGERTGDFLTALLANDLRDAAVRADEASLAGLPDTVRFLTHNSPPAAWGSRLDVALWREIGGLRGGGRLLRKTSAR